jgi:hypothetical protein
LYIFPEKLPAGKTLHAFIQKTVRNNMEKDTELRREIEKLRNKRLKSEHYYYIAGRAVCKDTAVCLREALKSTILALPAPLHRN